MRRILGTVLLCLLLWGCSGENVGMQEAVEFRSELVQAGGCSFQAQITAEFEQSVTEFSLDCQCSSEGTAQIVILSPESLQGVTATVTEKGGTLCYDGLAVDFGLLAEGKLAPAAAPLLLSQCWTSEYILSAGEQEGLCRVSYQMGYGEKSMNVDTWFENHLPIYAEICYNNERILKVSISEFSLNR